MNVSQAGEVTGSGTVGPGSVSAESTKNKNIIIIMHNIIAITFIVFIIFTSIWIIIKIIKLITSFKKDKKLYNKNKDLPLDISAAGFEIIGRAD